MDDNYDAYDYQDVPASDSQAYTTPVDSGNAQATDLSPQDSAAPVSSMADLMAALSPNDNTGSYASPSNASPIAAAVAPANAAPASGALAATANAVQASQAANSPTAAADAAAANPAGISASATKPTEAVGALSRIAKAFGLDDTKATPTTAPVVATPVTSGDAQANALSTLANGTPSGTLAELAAALGGGDNSGNPAGPTNASLSAGTPVLGGLGKVAAAVNAATGNKTEVDPNASTATKLLSALGINGDLSDPKNLAPMLKLLLGAGGVLGALNRKGTAQNALTPTQLRASVTPASTAFNPTQQAFADNYFNTATTPFATRARQYASSMQSPIVAGVGSNGLAPAKFADGGMVNPGLGDAPTSPDQYPYETAEPMSPVSNNYADGGEVSTAATVAAAKAAEPINAVSNLFDKVNTINGKFASDGALSLVAGNGGGQDDLVHAKLSPGEYVMDADTVASLGDGNNAHGAKVLDAWREELRNHKRSANSNAIPPKANSPSSYLKTGALTAMHNSRTK